MRRPRRSPGLAVGPLPAPVGAVGALGAGRAAVLARDALPQLIEAGVIDARQYTPGATTFVGEQRPERIGVDEDRPGALTRSQIAVEIVHSGEPLWEREATSRAIGPDGACEGLRHVTDVQRRHHCSTVPPAPPLGSP